MPNRPVILTDAERGRVDEIDRLVALGATGVGPLIAGLSDPSWSVRRAGVAALGRLGDVSVGPLCSWLSDCRTEEHSIAAVVDALATSIGRSATAAVIALLVDPRPEIAADAAQILGRRHAREAVPLLEGALSNIDDNVAVAAIEALGEIGANSSIEALIAVVGVRNFFRTLAALHVLARSRDPRAVGPLASLLGEQLYRLAAVRALGHTGSAHAVGPLASLLPSDDDAVVRLVGLALADLIAWAEWTGVVDPLAIALRAAFHPHLIAFARVLATADPTDRAALASLLGRIGDASVIPSLVRLVDDPVAHKIVIEAIQRICRLNDEAMIAALEEKTAMLVVLPVANSRRLAPIIRALLDDENPEVRARACEALARIGDTAAVPALFATLADSNPRVALAATSAIHSLGVADTSTRAIAALTSGSPTVRRYALRIITTMGFPDAFDAVCVATSDADSRVAELAVASLGAIDDARVDRKLVDLAGSPIAELRAAVMRAVVYRPTCAAAILENGLGDPLPWVRYYACQGVGRLRLAQLVDRLVERLADVAPHVRMSAIEALAHLDTPAAWQALCAVMQSPDPEERRAALAGVGLHHEAAALPFLLHAAGSPDVTTQLIALSGLSRRSESAALAAITTAATSRSTDVRDAALSLLGGRDDRAAAEAVVDLALASEPEHLVHQTLSRPGRARIDAIAARFAVVDDRRAATLAAALARMSEMATTVLFEALANENPSARRAAATVLVEMNVGGARIMVARLAIEDPDIDVRRVCAALVAG